MQIPVETLERLNSRCKRVADPGVNIEQLRRESESTRKGWWQESESIKAEYSGLPYDRDKFLESNIALARLKLVVAALENGEKPSDQHGFRQEEIDFLKEFEQFAIYDRLSVEDIKHYIKGGDDERGIIKLAKQASGGGYDQIYKVMERRNIPSDLALAFQRIYRERIKKMEAAAAEFRLSDLAREVEGVEAKAGVTTQDVQLLERSYITGLETMLKQAKGELKWKNLKKFDRLKRLHTELKTIKPTSMDHIKEMLPHGLGIKAVARKRKLLIFSSTFLLLEVRVLSDYRQLHLSGRDVERISPGEMMLHVEEVVSKIKRDPYVLALAATPGWGQQAIDRIKQVGSLYPNLRLVLIDLKGGDMHYEHDDKLERILPYLKPKS